MIQNKEESFDDAEIDNRNINDNSVRALEGQPLTSDGINSGDVTLRSTYVYKKARFTNVLRVIICLDSIVAIALWIAGGDSKYMVHSITEFTLITSTFDLAVIWLLKAPIYLVLLHSAEMVVRKSFDIAYNPVLIKRMQCLFAELYALSFAAFVYASVKGGFVLREFFTSKSHKSMHITYFVVCIWCFVLSLLVLLMILLSSKLMRKMKDKRKLKYFNLSGQEVDKDGKRVSSNASISRLVRLAKPEGGLLLGGFFMLLVTTGVQTVAPMYFGKVVDAALTSMSDLNRTVIILLCIYAVGSVASLFRSWMFTLAGQRLVARLREEVFGSVVLQEVAFFDTNRTGELCNRLSSDTQVIQNAVTVNVSMLFRYTLQILGSLALMFYLNPSLTGVLLAIVPVVSLTAMQYGKFVRKMRKKFQDKLAEAGTKAEETLSSVRTVRSFSGEMKETTEYKETVQQSYQIGKKLAMAQGFMDGLFSFLAYGAIGAVLWYGGKLVNENHNDDSKGITSGLLTSFLLYTLQVAMGFALLSSIYGDFMQAVGASARIFTLLDREPEIYRPDNPTVLPGLSGELEFKNVGFTYPSRPDTQVLKDISFEVRPGEMVALVGPSGGGKSTIVSLIERFYDPSQGTITAGGHDLKNLDMTWFRQKISMVSQEPTLFACSIRANIAYGRGATDEEVIEAAKQANAHEFITAFEDGYDTLVGERGIRLSGGQKQRVAIARALIMNPTLLLLDEATSALDAESEHLVQEAIDRAMKGRTVIVIAHRLSTVRNAHKVIVIDKGTIAEIGTHEELLQKNNVYKRLVMRQMTAGLNVNNSNEDDFEEDDFDEDEENDQPQHVEIKDKQEKEESGGTNGFSNQGFDDDSSDI